MAAQLTSLPAYKEGRIGDALVEVFHKMDSMLILPEHGPELELFRGKGETADGEESGEGSCSPTEALSVLKKIMNMKRIMNNNGEKSQEEAGASGVDDPADQEDSLPEHKLQAGCTAVVAVLKEGQLYVANAGRLAVVLLKRAAVEQLSTLVVILQHSRKGLVVADSQVHLVLAVFGISCPIYQFAFLKDLRMQQSVPKNLIPPGVGTAARLASTLDSSRLLFPVHLHCALRLPAMLQLTTNYYRLLPKTSGPDLGLGVSCSISR